MPEINHIAREIERKALELGFSACSFTPARKLTGLEAGFSRWLDEGRAGDMQYLSRNIPVRLDPGLLVEGARTIISLAASYFYPLPAPQPGSLRISRYARGQDYHMVLKRRGKVLMDWIHESFGPAKSRFFTDSAPLFEREWAQLAGVGWIGKNGCLIIPGKGSWFFLAEIVTDLDIPAEVTTVPDRCGTCTRCIEACPTGCLSGDGSMDPRKCISYLTIENQGDIPEDFRGKMNDWIFGCDICQDVCPWNRNPLPSQIPEFEPREEITAIGAGHGFGTDTTTELPDLGDSPLARTGWEGLKRNIHFVKFQ